MGLGVWCGEVPGLAARSQGCSGLERPARPQQPGIPARMLHMCRGTDWQTPVICCLCAACAAAHPSNTPFSTDLELLEGLDSSKHGERAMSVAALVKELDASVHGGRMAAAPKSMGSNGSDEVAVRVM